MITKIGPANQINYQARIKIQKKGFENLLKDVGDSTSIGSRTTSSVSSTASDITTFPWHWEEGSYNNSVERHMDVTEIKSDAIGKRDLKTINKSDYVNASDATRTSIMASEGSSLAGTGTASSYSSGGLAIEQSVYHPNSLYDPSAYESLKNISTPKSADIIDNSANWAHQNFNSEQGLGNRIASSYSTSSAIPASLSETVGSSMTLSITTPFIPSSKKIPS